MILRSRSGTIRSRWVRTGPLTDASPPEGPRRRARQPPRGAGRRARCVGRTPRSGRRPAVAGWRGDRRARSVHGLVEPAVGQGRPQRRAGPLDRVVPERVELLGGVVGGGGEVPVGAAVPAEALPGSPSGSPRSLVRNMWSSTAARCLSSPPRVSEEAPTRTCSPAASRPPAFQRNVVRRRSSAPSSCSVSVPAMGGSHGGWMVVMTAAGPRPPGRLWLRGRGPRGRRGGRTRRAGRPARGGGSAARPTDERFDGWSRPPSASARADAARDRSTAPRQSA